jgi:branched-chain amino acid transport system substrate-binding protein
MSESDRYRQLSLAHAGDRACADFDFWAVRTSGGTHAWTHVAGVGGYETRSGALSR